MTKEEHTIELAMRFAVAMRMPALIASNGLMLNFNPADGYNPGHRLSDRAVARFAIAMAREHLEEMYCAVSSPPDTSAIETPDDDLEKTRIRF